MHSNLGKVYEMGDISNIFIQIYLFNIYIYYLYEIYLKD